MQIKIMNHRLRDSLFVVSEDIYKMLHKGCEPKAHLTSLFNNQAEIVYDKGLSDMTIMVPDREYFDADIDNALESMSLFSETYLNKGK